MKTPLRYWHVSGMMLSSLLILAAVSFFNTGHPILDRLDFFSDVKAKVNSASLEAIKAELHSQSDDKDLRDTLPADYDHHLDLFFKAIENLKDSEGTVHIAYFGDSQIEGDLLTADLRRSFQKKWGGNGVGWMPLTSIVAGFRTTIGHSYSNWNVTDILTKGKRQWPLGPSGHAFAAYPGSEVKYWNREYNFKKVQIIGHPQSSGEFEWDNGKSNGTFHWPDSIHPNFAEEIIQQNASKFSLKCTQGDPILYGMNFENGNGVYVDNFSFRGNSGTSLSQLDQSMLANIDSLIPYRLVIVHYGLNVIGHGVTDYSNYQKSMERTLNHVKKCFPKASILLIGMTDKGYRNKGTWESDPSVLYLLKAQKEMSENQDIAFFSLYDAMGGEGSIVSWVQDSLPKLANADYTHMNHRGSKKLASYIEQYINQSYKVYLENKKHEQ